MQNLAPPESQLCDHASSDLGKLAQPAATGNIFIQPERKNQYPEATTNSKVGQQPIRLCGATRDPGLSFYG